MAHVKLLIHAVWGTKNRIPFLTKDIRSSVFQHIKENARQKNIYIDRINGYTDHVHCLFFLNADMSIAKVMQLIKGESSFWINKEKLTTSKFEWADEYYAASVSESLLGTVRAYIDNQESHHSIKTYQEEYDEFLRMQSSINHG
ncbi:MAG: IS200/IS605 family transposase [Saprospiraceae bacterium]|nr:IS200/IS605 family transposase [Saprospiraceae bacterium]